MLKFLIKPKMFAYFLFLSFILLTSACQSIQFKVIRPAKINVVGMTPEGKDPSISIGKWEGHAPNAIDSLISKISQLILNSPKNIIKLDQSGRGIVKLDGHLHQFQYEEKLNRENQKCTRYNEKSKKHEQYNCTLYTLVGTARIKASIRVLDQSKQVLGGDTVNEYIKVQNSAYDEQPAAIDGNLLLDQVESIAAEKFAKIVVPYRDTVHKEWFSCGDASKQCDLALKALQSENFSQAKDLLFEAIKMLEEKNGSDSDFAATWWALALSQEFSGDFSNAKASLQEALKYKPTEEVFLQEMSSIKREEENAKKLAKQGLQDAE
jgi:tetratricopeptide (TPR) repeat protein